MTKTGESILRRHRPRVTPARSVTWPEVLVREEHERAHEHEHAEGRDGEGKHDNARGERLVRHAVLIARLRAAWLTGLIYEVIFIPLRAAFPAAFAMSGAAIACDALVDTVKIISVAVRLRRGGIRIADEPAAQGRAANSPSPGAGAVTLAADDPPYGARRLCIEMLAIVLPALARAVYATTGRAEPFVAAQLVRSCRVVELGAYVQWINGDLAANVQLVAGLKFALVLLATPHWIACVWVMISDGWHAWDDAPIALPQWAAQFELLSENSALNAAEINLYERCTCGASSAWLGDAGEIRLRGGPPPSDCDTVLTRLCLPLCPPCPDPLCPEICRQRRTSCPPQTCWRSSWRGPA
jgi:hypothetical protein